MYGKIKEFIGKRKYWLLVILTLLLVSWWTGFLTGWIGVKGKMGSFPEVGSQTRLLVISPHPDDEVLIAGGLIQRVLSMGGQVKVVFLTNGDASRGTAVYEDKNLKLSPDEFLAIGIQRMKEARNVDTFLKVSPGNIIFLGFPDQGLMKILNRYYDPVKDGTYVSTSTKYDHVPYDGVYKNGQPYTGVNLYTDIKEIADDFKPTIVVTTHIRDTHPDHRAAFDLVQKLEKEEDAKWSFLASVVHYHNYPEVSESGFIYPPKKLFGSDWVSFDITGDEKKIKMDALMLYKSQFENLGDRILFKKLDASNEIFETEQ